MSDAPEVMSIDELAEYLQLSPATIHRLAREGALPGRKFGRRWWFSASAVDAWLRRRRARGKSKRGEGR